MATTQNTFTGDGSNLGPFSFTFKWLEPTDIKVTVAGVLKTVGTHYNLQSLNYSTKTGGQVLFTAGNAPANNAAIVVYRQTDDSDLAATFYSGSAIRAQDLNNNFVQGLYVTQESSNIAASATSTANTALTNSSTAISTANTALSTANTAATNASAAVSTANTANTNASAAVSTANNANTNATAAVNTANAANATAASAAADAATAISTANGAVTTANAASTSAANAVTTANTASSAANSAVSTANTASTNAANAVTTANTASANATTAVNTANTANAKADSAIAAISSSAVFTPVANVAAIPASPTNGQNIQVTDSTGIESFTPLAGVPVGFVGDSGIAARIQYSGGTWNWFGYFATNSDARYLKTSGGTLTGQLKADDSTSTATPVYSFDGDTNTGLARTGSDELALVTGGTARLTVDGSGNVNAPGSFSTPAVSSGIVGVTTSVSFIDQTNPAYAASITPSSGATSNSTYTLPSSTGSNGQLLSTNGSGGLSWTNPVDISGKLDTSSIGTTVQAYDAQLADIAGLTPADGAFIVGNGTSFVAESGPTALTSIGAASSSTSVSAGTGLTGGGDLSANRTVSADIASQAEAEAGTNSSKLMTPQRTKQAITALSTAANFQEFTSSGTWTKPASCNFVLVEVWGAGGGGGSGGRNANPANGGTGGGGGGGGAYNQRLFKAADVASSVTVTIGSGGNGGASPGANTTNANGNSGTNGGNTTFGSLLTGYGGGSGQGGAANSQPTLAQGGGGGGTLSAGSQSTAGEPYIGVTNGGAFGGSISNTSAPYQSEPSGWGGAAGGTSRSDGTNSLLTPTPGACSSHGGAGGGAGGGWNGFTAGSAGGSSAGDTGGGGTAGSSGGGSGGAGSARQGGGGGGAASGGNNGGAGGAGGQPGGGGGGGGQAFQPGAPGAGGAGGAGLCRVYTW